MSRRLRTAALRAHPPELARTDPRRALARPWRGPGEAQLFELEAGVACLAALAAGSEIATLVAGIPLYLLTPRGMASHG